MKALIQFKNLPETKEEVKSFVEQAKNEILQGDADIRVILSQMEHIEETINLIRRFCENRKHKITFETVKYLQIEHTAKELGVMPEKFIDIAVDNYIEQIELNLQKARDHENNNQNGK